MNDIPKQVYVNKHIGPLNINTNTEYKVGSIINQLLHLLAKQDNFFTNSNNNIRRPPAKTITKIKYNNLNERKYIISVYQKHSLLVENAMQNINSLIPFGKEKILDTLNNIYLESLDYFDIDFLDENYLPKIIKNSCEIIDFILLKLKNNIIQSDCTNLFTEDIDLGVQLLVAFSFIECQILENPNDP